MYDRIAAGVAAFTERLEAAFPASDVDHASPGPSASGRQWNVRHGNGGKLLFLVGAAVLSDSDLTSMAIQRIETGGWLESADPGKWSLRVVAQGASVFVLVEELEKAP